MQSVKELFARFVLVGVLGFLVDATVVALCVHLIGLGPYHARVYSYLCAVTTTWWLNRRYTFGSTSAPLREFLTFLLANSLGAAINLLVYAALIAWKGSEGLMPVAAVALGSLSGLFTNFFLSKAVVFSKRAGPAATRRDNL